MIDLVTMYNGLPGSSLPFAFACWAVILSLCGAATSRVNFLSETLSKLATQASTQCFSPTTNGTGKRNAADAPKQRADPAADAKPGADSRLADPRLVNDGNFVLDFCVDALYERVIRCAPKNILAWLPDANLILLAAILHCASVSSSSSIVPAYHQTATGDKVHLSLIIWQRFLWLHALLIALRTLALCSTMSGFAAPRTYVRVRQGLRSNKVLKNDARPDGKNIGSEKSVEASSVTSPARARMSGGVMNNFNFDLMFSGHTCTGSLLMILLVRVIQISEGSSAAATSSTSSPHQDISILQNYSSRSLLCIGGAVVLGIGNSLLQVAVGDHWTVDVVIANYVTVPITLMLTQDLLIYPA
eukprot:TRINITY_DN68438_c0_g1_i1.p1 TRINITY_DN68438_c0_g1~~TRINITY_DN68438_c0_g1_i1.p1  ORF type:complete len:359 (-),score=18.79 TRINITY_DN68438_c0_g1_i1:321-1397(-)